MYCPSAWARATTGRAARLEVRGCLSRRQRHGGYESLPPRVDPVPPPPSNECRDRSGLGETHVVVAPFNDLSTTEKIITEYATELAAVIVEPLQRCVPPRDQFLQGLRELTRRHGILLIFDEVVTGFRLALGGWPGVLRSCP